ncbi:MAG: hypothetical protein R3F43_21750 [bacterium]
MNVHSKVWHSGEVPCAASSHCSSWPSRPTGCWLPPGDFTTPEYWAAYFLDIYADDLEIGGAGGREPAPPLEEPRTVLLITGVTIPARWFGPIAARLRQGWLQPGHLRAAGPAELRSGGGHRGPGRGGGARARRERAGPHRHPGRVHRRRHRAPLIQSQGGEAHVDRMVTFVSPQHGVDKAPWAKPSRAGRPCAI